MPKEAKYLGYTYAVKTCEYNSYLRYISAAWVGDLFYLIQGTILSKESFLSTNYCYGNSVWYFTLQQL